MEQSLIDLLVNVVLPVGILGYWALAERRERQAKEAQYMGVILTLTAAAAAVEDKSRLVELAQLGRRIATGSLKDRGGAAAAAEAGSEQKG